MTTLVRIFDIDPQSTLTQLHNVLLRTGSVVEMRKTIRQMGGIFDRNWPIVHKYEVTIDGLEIARFGVGDIFGWYSPKFRCDSEHEAFTKICSILRGKTVRNQWGRFQLKLPKVIEYDPIALDNVTIRHGQGDV